MWIAVRILAALIGFVYRAISGPRPWGLKRRGKVRDLEIWESVARYKDKLIAGYTIAAELRAPVIFRLSRERTADRFFKALGIASEIQTRDEHFDKTVYVVCDHDGLAAVLNHNKAARSAVLAALGSGLKTIVLDGRFLSVTRIAGHPPTDADIERLAQLHRVFAVLSSQLGRRFQDRYFLRMALVEGVTWSLAAYGILAFVQLIFDHSQVHLDLSSLILTGLSVAALIFGGLVMFIVVLLRGSSGGPRIIVESLVLLLIGLPAVGIQMAADINTTMDVTPPVQHVGTITHTRVKRLRRSRVYYIKYEPGVSETVEEMRVSYGMYHRAAKGMKLKMAVGQGRLGLKWYKEVVVIP